MLGSIDFARLDFKYIALYIAYLFVFSKQFATIYIRTKYLNESFYTHFSIWVFSSCHILQMEYNP